MAEPDFPSGRLEDWLVLGLACSTSPAIGARIRAAFPSEEAAVLGGPSEWSRQGLLPRPKEGSTLRPGSGDWGPEPLFHLRDTEAWARDQIREARRRSVRLLVLGSDGYPPLLKEAPAPPPVLFVKGDASVLAAPAVAVVGARRATPYGRGIARSLGAELAAAGVLVVSGGARGIDSEAHRGALDAGGRTLAVMGCGLDWVYPPENAALFRRIVEQGALVSEFPFGIAPQPYHFPIRNRVIAGLTLGVVVVEGRRGSGSLITAARALEANREVMAVPGPVTASLSDGPNALLAEGARVVRSAADVIDALPWWAGVERPAEGGREGAAGAASGEDRAFLGAVDPLQGSTVDEIAEVLGLGPGEVIGRLTALELEGRVEQTAGGRYVRRP
jgi:DNA processing protein